MPVHAEISGDFGQLGHGSKQSVSVPQVVAGLSKVAGVAAGSKHSVAITGMPANVVFVTGSQMMVNFMHGDAHYLASVEQAQQQMC